MEQFRKRSVKRPVAFLMALILGFACAPVEVRALEASELPASVTETTVPDPENVPGEAAKISPSGQPDADAEMPGPEESDPPEEEPEEIPALEDNTAPGRVRIRWDASDKDGLTVTVSPEKEDYGPEEEVSLYVDLKDGYALDDVKVSFGEEELTPERREESGYDAVFAFSTPASDFLEVQEITVFFQVRASFGGYELQSRGAHTTVAFDRETRAGPGETVTATVTAEDGYVLPEDGLSVTAVPEGEAARNVEYDLTAISEDRRSCTVSFTVPDLGRKEAVLLVNADAVRQYFIRRITAESDSGSEDILNAVSISPKVLYEGVTVTVQGIPKAFGKNTVFPFGEENPKISMVLKEDGYAFSMPAYDVEIICEEALPPLVMDPSDVYTPNTEFTYEEKSKIPHEPSMEVKKTASWTNIQAGEAQVTIGEYDLNQYTNLPCDYIILVDCSDTMGIRDGGSSKTRYQLANEAISKMLDKIQADNRKLSDEMKSRVAFMTYSGSGDNGRHPTTAAWQSDYYIGGEDTDYFLSGVYEYAGFTTNVEEVRSKLNTSIRRGSKISLALDKTLELLKQKGTSRRSTKVINVSDCGNSWDRHMREGYYSGNKITDWMGIHNPDGVTSNDKVEAIKNMYGAYFIQVCIGPPMGQEDILRTSVSEATGDHMFWTYDGSNDRFEEIFTQVHDMPFEISASGKTIVDLFDTTYWDVTGVKSCSTGMDTVTLSGNRLVWKLPDHTAEQPQTCTVSIRLKDAYRYLAVSDALYRTNADGNKPGLTYSYVIDGGIYDGETRDGGVNTPVLKYGTVEFSGKKVWTVDGSRSDRVVTTLRQTLPGHTEAAIETAAMAHPDWSYSYTNKKRKEAGKYPYVKYNNQGQTVSYRVTENVPAWYTEKPALVTAGERTVTNFYNEPYKIRARLRKVDGETKNPLTGAVFQVYQWSLKSGSYVPYKGQTKGTVSGTSYEAGSMDGGTAIMELKETAGGVYETPSWLYYSQDNGGRFAIVETKAPEGYFGDWKDPDLVTKESTDQDKIFHEFTIDSGGSNNGQTVVMANGADDLFSDQRTLGQIDFSKCDKESEDALPQGEAALAGAEYKLYAASDIVHKDGATGVLYRAGEEIRLKFDGAKDGVNIYVYADKDEDGEDTMVIPESGRVLIRELELGEYFLRETKAGEGYLIDPEIYRVTLTYEGEKVGTVRPADGFAKVFEQVKKQKLSFYKITGEDNQDRLDPFSGAGFSIYPAAFLNGGKYRDYTDEELVQAVIDDYRDRKTLLYDRIKHTMPAIVYEEADGEDVTSGRLTKSVTYATGETQRIDRKNGYLVSELRSDEKGVVTTPSLPYGRYVVVETTTPKGRTATRPFVIRVEADDEHMTTDTASDTGGKKLEDMVFLLDRPVSSLIRIEKADSRSNRTVLKPGAAYVIHDLDGVWFDYAMNERTTAERRAYKEKYQDLVVQYVQGEYVGSRENPFVTRSGRASETLARSTYIDTVESLPAGTYELEEIMAPDGYVLQGSEGVIKKSGKGSANGTFFETEEDGAWQAVPTERTRFLVSSEYAVYDEQAGSFVTVVRQLNDPAIGKISVYAEGEKLAGAKREDSTIVSGLTDGLWDLAGTVKELLGMDTDVRMTEEELAEYRDYVFEYEMGPIEGAEFKIYAAEDIYPPEYDQASRELLEEAGTPVKPLLARDQEVLTLVTDEKGQAWTGGEDWPDTGEAKGLPLGSYYVIQTKAGYGHVLTEENQKPRTVRIDYAGQTVPVIYRDLAYENPRQKLNIEVTKIDKETKETLSGAVFGLYAKEDIRTEKGKTVVKAGTLVAVAETGLSKDGTVKNAVFAPDLPSARYEIRELMAPEGYVSSDVRLSVDGSYQEKNQTVLELQMRETFENRLSRVQINLMDYYTEVELSGAKLKVLNEAGATVETIESVHENNPIIRGLKPGERYTLQELTARDGYEKLFFLKDGYESSKENAVECEKRLYGGKPSDQIQFAVRDTESLQTVSVFNQPMCGELTIQKTGQVPVNPRSVKEEMELVMEDGSIRKTTVTRTEYDWEETGLPGAEYALRAAEDIVYPDGYTGVLFRKGDMILDQYEKNKDTGLLKYYRMEIGDGSLVDVSAYRGTVPDTELRGDELAAFYQEHAGAVERQFPSEEERQTDKKTYGGTGLDMILRTGEAGLVSLKGLPFGSYEAAEVQAPEGYYRSVKDAVKPAELKEVQEEADMLLSETLVYHNERQQPGPEESEEIEKDRPEPTIILYHPDIQVVKTADRSYCRAGETVNYHISVLNTGDVELKDIPVYDSLSDEVIRTIPTLKAGENTGFDYAYEVPKEAENGDQILNVVIVKGTPVIPDPGEDAYGNPIITDPASYLEPEDWDREMVVVTDDKDAPDESPDPGDEPEDPSVLSPGIRIVKTADKKTYYAGETVHYTLTVTNTGDTALTDVTVSEEYLENGSFVAATNGSFEGNQAVIEELLPGQTETLKYDYQVPEGLKKGAAIDNVVFATGRTIPEEQPAIGTTPDGTPIYPPGIWVSDRDQERVYVEVPGTGLTVTKYGVDENIRHRQSGARFAIFAAEDVKNIFGTVVIPAGSLVETAVSDETGMARFSSNLPIGKYVVREAEAPRGYYRSGKIIDFDLEKWKNADEVLYLNDHGEMENAVTVVKVMLVDDMTYNPLSGAALQVTDETGEPTEAWVTVYDDGYRIKGLEPGRTWRILEILPREGYLGSFTDAEVLCGDGKITNRSEDTADFYLEQMAVDPKKDGVPEPVEILLSNLFVVGQVNLSKEGKMLETVSVLDRAGAFASSLFDHVLRPLEHVEFTMYAEEDIFHPDGVSGVMLRAGDTALTGVRGLPRKAVQKTGVTGLTEFRNMYLGTYRLKETRTQKGFRLDSEERMITFAYKDKRTSPVSAEAGDVHWINERLNTFIRLIKHDADDQEKLLSGAVFGLYNKSALESWSGEALVPADTLLETMETKEDGIAELTLPLPEGSYYIRELTAPAGYELDGQTGFFEAAYEENGEDLVVEMDFYNKVIPKRHRGNKDPKDPEEKPVPGVVAGPPTGDSLETSVWLAAIILAAAGILAVGTNRKRHK